ncbi:Meiosis 1 arrest protein [Exaiptasia diaphana]|nr:Meiosis 1 arrest protein [Exaiptasia diaphana]
MEQESTSPVSSSETGVQGCGIVDVITLQKDPISFQRFFKMWLLDCETDQEHIRIELPSPFPLGSQGAEAKDADMLMIKCDIHERLINPAHLPFRSQFEINTEALSKTLLNKSCSSLISYPVHTMKVDKLLKREAICESVPYIIRSTVCWKLDWEELERNQQYFHAFCNILQERDLAALLKIACGQPRLPTGYYILMPSHGSTMLLKAVATNELLLPTDFNQSEPTTETTELIAASLDLIQVNDCFNPVFVESGLYKSLANLSLKGIKHPLRPAKKGFQAPKKYQEETPKPPQSKSNRALPKRVVFAKDSTKAAKRSRTAPPLDIYVSSPTDLTDDP